MIASQFNMLVLYVLTFAALFCYASALNDMVIDGNAILLPISAPYGRAINGLSFQTQPLLTFGGFQFAAWYHNNGATARPTIYLGRRNLSQNSWQSFDTGIRWINGAAPFWDAHHIVSMGISAEGKIHLAYDVHANTLRYSTSIPGAATSATWTSRILQAERNSLNIGEPSIDIVTYPRFVPIGQNQLLLTYRQGYSGDGNVFMTTYNSTTGRWDTPRNVISGKGGKFTDELGSSNQRNAYLNGVSRGPDGKLHMTWTWRESALGANHDTMYAYSRDDGRTWRNNQGLVVGQVGVPIQLNSPGIVIVRKGRRQSLINDQSQTVDRQGGVHVLMWHRRGDELGYLWKQGDPPIFINDAAYYHYYRNPSTGAWARKRLPTSRTVGSRPQVAVDAGGNLFAVYTSPIVPPTNNTLYVDGIVIIAGARRLANNEYAEWSILWTGSRLYSGEPLVDRSRLSNDGILSIFVQESSRQLGATGSPLHVLEFNV